MKKQFYRLINSAVKMNLLAMVNNLPLDGSIEVVIQPYKKPRSLDSNAKMWAMLTEISESVVWYGNKLTKENWKDVFTASLKKQTVVPGLDGGFVVCGTSTSKMSTREMSDLIELMIAFGVEKEVKFKL